MSLIERTCVACGQTDDHPKCLVASGDTLTAWHHDCHARIEPPCPACTWLVQHKGDLTGPGWREQVASLHAELTDEQKSALQPHERPVIESHRDGNRPS